jgi:hypothetical protein
VNELLLQLLSEFDGELVRTEAEGASSEWTKSKNKTKNFLNDLVVLQKKWLLLVLKKVQLKPDYKMDFFKDFSWFFSLKIIFLKKLVKRRFLLTLFFRNNFFANNICFEL